MISYLNISGNRIYGLFKRFRPASALLDTGSFYEFISLPLFIWPSYSSSWLLRVIDLWNRCEHEPLFKALMCKHLKVTFRLAWSDFYFCMFSLLICLPSLISGIPKQLVIFSIVIPLFLDQYHSHLIFFSLATTFHTPTIPCLVSG